jgi:Protochlamydia outer membrane protein
MSLIRLTLLFLVGLSPVLPDFARAQEDAPRPQEESSTAVERPPLRRPPPDILLTVGFREWISQGRSGHNIGNFGGPNVASELSWRGLNSVITQFSGDLLVNRFVADLSVGFGSIGSGTLIDQDWNGNNRTNKLEETFSPVTEAGITMVTLDVGARLLTWTFRGHPLPGAVDFLLGYQYWRERYVATGVQDLFPPISPSTGARAITQTNTWNSFRLGIRAIVPLHSRFALKGSVFYIPLTSHENEDIHHLRSDLRRNPSFLTTATGGNGVQLEGSAVLRLWRTLTVEAGYAYWDIRSGQGTVEAFFENGRIGVAPHNDEHTRRQGVFFGVNYTF